MSMSSSSPGMSDCLTTNGSRVETVVGMRDVASRGVVFCDVENSLAWLVRLRWLAIVGQLLLVLAAPYVLVDRIETFPLFLILLACAASNLVLQRASSSKRRVATNGGVRITARRLGVILLFDVAALTGLLFFTGGAANPFGFFYVLHVALAALLLGERWAWGIAALSVLLYGALFFVHVPVAELSSHGSHHDSSLSLHLQGMWVAFALVSAMLAFFFTRILRDMHRQRDQLRMAQERMQRAERLSAVTAMGATAAHELNTPLCTIAVAAGEMMEGLKEIQARPELVADAQLIAGQVSLCREVLQRLRRASGDFEGQVLNEITLEEVVTEVRSRLSDSESARVLIDPGSERVSLRVPRDVFVDILRALVQNALEASAKSAIRVQATRAAATQVIQVQDSGKGISEDIRTRLGEPFVTSKVGGTGLGLGVFLAKSMVERMRGALQFVSTLGEGTTVIIELPA